MIARLRYLFCALLGHSEMQRWLPGYDVCLRCGGVHMDGRGWLSPWSKR